MEPHMEIFEKNITALEKKYGYVAEKIKQIDINEIGINDTAMGQQILYKMHEGKPWNLNSRLDAQTAAEVYASRYEIRIYGSYFIFGLSDGRCVREIMRKCDETNFLMICEPDLESFTVACHFFDLQDILENESVLIYFSDIEKSMHDMLQMCVEYPRMKLLEFCILPGYDVLYHEQCEAFMDEVVEYMRYMEVNKATSKTFNRSIPQNRLYHMKKMLDYSNLCQLKHELEKYDLTDYPVIIVSAGPSLDKNIHLLKQAQGKALIIAVDASIRSTIQAGVRPEMLCSVDPKSPDRFFSDLDLKDIYWICNDMTNPDLLKKYVKHVFYYGNFGKLWAGKLYDKLGIFCPPIISGGSVSTEAFALAVYLGFRKIIFIGQDLAFTGGISHTKGIAGALGDNDAYIQKRKKVLVEGIDGIMLETDFQMWFYKGWIEKVIRNNKEELRVIDATEGGARIEGAEIMTLQEVIDKECRHEFDIYDIEQKISPMCTKEQKEELENYLKQMREDIIEFAEKIDNIIQEQETIIEEIRTHKNLCMHVTEKLRRVTELNQEIESEPIREYLISYAQNEEYEMGENIYTEEELSPEQLVEKSLALLKGYQKGAKLFLEDFDEIIMKDE